MQKKDRIPSFDFLAVLPWFLFYAVLDEQASAFFLWIGRKIEKFQCK